MNDFDKNETITGVIENVVYRNPNNDYTVFEISDKDDELITAVGIIPMAFEGEKVTLTGCWTYHKEFGKQFSFETFDKSLPEEEDGILQYLSSGTIKGVGPITALKIVNRFGVESFDVIENNPEWLTDISGITSKKAALISESFREQTGMRGIMMLCKDYMGTGEAARVYKKLGAGATGIILENPYILCDDDYGLPFDRVDKFAKTIDVMPESPLRIYSGTRFVLKYNADMNGHTCLPYEKLIPAVAELLSIEVDVVAENVLKFLAENKLSSYNTGEENFIMTNEVERAEKYIYRRICELESEVEKFSSEEVSLLLEKLENKFDIRYAPMQKEAMYQALEGGIMILTGGPGTGKTTVIKALISIFGSLGMKCVLAAPTGRAAKRMSEATSTEAKTVHRMLDMERGQDNKIKFGRNEKNRLEEKVVIVDEASMMDIFLTEALFSALKRGARLLLIGDANQLPSVGAGNVFADLIDCGKIRTVKLTEIFRQSKESLIITNAHRINEGLSPVLNVTDNDFFFVQRSNEQQIPEVVADLITKRLPKAYGSDIKEKIQVITPSRKGSGGVEVLNFELQNKINPPKEFKKEKQYRGIIYREGDRVMQTVNNYDIEWEKNGVVGMGIFNGDIGVIEEINHKEPILHIRFEDKLLEYPFDMLDDLDLAYAITVHKSQGSEYPVVIIPAYHCAPMLMTRNLLYTAVTRAKKMVVLVGSAEVPAIMAANNSEILRYTTLIYRISNL